MLREAVGVMLQEATVLLVLVLHDNAAVLGLSVLWFGCVFSSLWHGHVASGMFKCREQYWIDFGVREHLALDSGGQGRLEFDVAYTNHGRKR